MEIEYKWDLPDSQIVQDILASSLVADAFTAHQELRMHAIYFDTEHADIARMRGGLRIRRENDASVCCLKLSAQAQDNCKTRREYEVEADSIEDGLRKLPQVGAPRDLCEQLRNSNPRPICETEFARQAYTLELAEFAAELAIDVGEMRRGEKGAPIHEIELEYLDGSQDAFHAFAAQLQDDFALVTQPLSKLARAATL